MKQDSPAWIARRRPPPLGAGEVHLWRVQVPDASGMPPAWAALLAPEEQANVARKRLPIDARRTLASRACLRLLLGQYLGLPPDSLAFATTATGKPFLASRTGAPSLEFNVSHSGDWVVLAFTRDAPLGVDVECERVAEYSDLVNHFFSPAEREAWAALPKAAHTQAFFAAWTAKESYLKALGTGLSEPLDRITVGFSRTAPTRLPAPANAPGWLIVPLDIGPGYACAVCIGAEPVSLHTFTFETS